MQAYQRRLVSHISTSAQYVMGGLYLQENLCWEHEIHSPVRLCVTEWRPGWRTILLQWLQNSWEFENNFFIYNFLAAGGSACLMFYCYYSPEFLLFIPDHYHHSLSAHLGPTAKQMGNRWGLSLVWGLRQVFKTYFKTYWSTQVLKDR